MRLTVLADNRTKDDALTIEHGLCVLLDTGLVKVLLDTGASDVFLRNASVLGIDLADVDYIFISHGHIDHSGGLAYMLEKNKKAKVIVSSAALGGSYHSSRNGMHDISPAWPYELLENRIISVDKDMEIAGMNVIRDICCRHSLPKADKCLYRIDSDGEYVPDDFRHEMALQTGGFLFTGCAHNGLMNIMESAVRPVHTVLGGFHLLDAAADEDFEKEPELVGIAADLHSRYPDAVFYTGHCTGDKAFISMKKVLGDNLLQFSCGMSLEI